MYAHNMFLPLLGNIHMDCVSRIMMHVFMGWTYLLVEIIMDFDAKIETMMLGSGSAKT